MVHAILGIQESESAKFQISSVSFSDGLSPKKNDTQKIGRLSFLKKLEAIFSLPYDS